MDKHKFRFQLKRAAINLVPSAVIFSIIASGAALHVSWFELSWNNDIVFVLLVLAVLMPLTKLPLLFLIKEEPLIWQLGTWFGESACEYVTQLESVQSRPEDSLMQVGESKR